ncbi:unnamed protein product, partial [marine sediment metagenome]
MKQVGIIGLGDMGIGMAKNIIKNGFDLVGYDFTGRTSGNPRDSR